jgi:hypothetical protein
MTILLVMYVLNGEASTFAVETPGPEECIVMQAQVAEVLPKLIGALPQLFAAACAEVKPFVTDT